MKKTITRCVMLAYALVSSVFLGGLVGFLIIFPIIQLLLERAGITYECDEPLWVKHLIYVIVVFSISICIYFNNKRYLMYARKRELI